MDKPIAGQARFRARDRTSAPLRMSALLAVVAALAACQHETAEPSAASSAGGATPAEPTTAGDAPVPAAAVEYGSGIIGSQWQCDDEHVAARFDNTAGTVTVTHGRGELVLAQAPSASGARYADANGNEFWSKGNAATLTLSGTEPRQCRQIEPLPG